ncbi:MAG: hypothetical protein ACK42L_00180 [Thermoanaerobaculum sp.]
MLGVRLPFAGLAALLLAGVLAGMGGLPTAEALAGGLALAFLGLVVSKLSGWVRFGCELLLLPPAYVLVLTRDPFQRQMLLSFLVALAAWACLWGLSRQRPAHGRLAASLWALALVLPGLPVLVGKFGLASVVALVPVLAAGLLATQGPWVWGLAAALGVALASPAHPGVGVGLVAAVWFLSRKQLLISRFIPFAQRWAVPLVAFGLLGSLLFPWGGLLAFPGFPTSAWFLGIGVLLAVITAFLPVPLAAATWFLGISVFWPALPVAPDLPGPTLSQKQLEAFLPAGEAGKLYSLELALANAGSLPAGTVVGWLEVGQERVLLRAGRDTAEWALLREDLEQQGAHGLPAHPVFRPTWGANPPWAVAGRVDLFVPSGVTPKVVLAPDVGKTVTLSVLQTGPQKPTPKRSIAAKELLWAAGLVLLVFLPGFWRSPWVAAPWALLAFGRLALGLPLQPLRVLLERHGVDLALAAFLLGWWLAFARHLRLQRWSLPVLAWLLPLALVAPRLAELVGDEPYHVLMAESLVKDHDLKLENNASPERYAQWVVDLVRQVPDRFLHSPGLALLLAFGYAVAGRAGMVVLMSLLGALAFVLLQKQAGALPGAAHARRLAALSLLFAYPFVTFATQIWVEMVGVLAVTLLLLWVRQARPFPAAAVAVATVVMKARLGLVSVPLAAVSFWRRWQKRLWAPVLGVLLAGGLGLGLATLWFGNPLDPLGRRALSHLVPQSLRQPLVVTGGLLFDAAYGIAFSSPIWLVALLGLPALWRRGGLGERTLLLGGLATWAALLNYVEWRGGGSPPFRYLVPLLPLFFLGLAQALRRDRTRALVFLALPPTLFTAWIAVTRPPMLFNIGDGGQWLADRLAARFSVDARHFFPSYLRISPASYVTPVVLLLLALGLWFACSRPAFRRFLMRQVVALWLAAAAGLLLALRTVPDRVVELEDPQVEHRGGVLEPHPGAWTRFLYPNGWRLFSRDSVHVPLHVAKARELVVSGWMEGPSSGELCYTLNSGPASCLPISPGAIAVPLPAPDPGRYRLTLQARLPKGASVVLDKLEVRR